jgi:beta-xylosidase
VLTNPIVRGFHYDPIMVRVGDQYAVATSTFEWFATRMYSRAAAPNPVAEPTP